MKILHRVTNTISIANFWENYLLGKYDFAPAYQRHSIWSDEKRSYLIDSILRNFPIPPIFLHQHIDPQSGKTIYDVIDGKQRLEAIIAFIKNEIPITSESGMDDAEPGAVDAADEPLAGLYFRDLETKNLSPYRDMFWRYSLPIEYVESADQRTIETIFDRLNRNGEPLEGQELRHAKFHSSLLIRTVRAVAEEPFWKARLQDLDASRMEDIEFLSELFFVLLEGGPQPADKKLIDDMYQKWANDAVFADGQLVDKFRQITAFMVALQLNYGELKIGGASHLYGLWCFSIECVKRDIPAETVRDRLNNLFLAVRNTPITDPIAQDYRKSMSYNTKGKAQRQRRLNDLLQAAHIVTLDEL